MKRFISQLILFILDILCSGSKNEKKKFLDEIDIDHLDIEVLTDTGYHPIKSINKTKAFKIYRIFDVDGSVLLECADNHIVFNENMEEVFVKDLHPGSIIQTDHGASVAWRIENTDWYQEMYDIEVDHPDHRYYTNSILSHNTTTTAIFFAHFSIFNTDKMSAIVAQRDQIAAEIFRKIKSIILYLPFFLKPGINRLGGDGYSFDNGCQGLFRPATIDCLQGYTIDFMFIDEFAYIKNTKAHEFWSNAYPVLSSMKNSKVTICSTPNGRNLFYDLWTAAIERKSFFVPFRIDYWEVPGRDEAWVQQEIANLGSKAKFDQQYGLSFDTNVACVLDPEAFHFLSKISHQFEPGLFKLGTDYDECFRWSTQWKYSIKNDWWVISIDIGEGLGQDYSVIKFRKMFLDDNGNIIMPTCGVFESNTIIIEAFAKVIMMVLHKFNQDKIRVIIERNSYGDLLMKNIDSLTEHLPKYEIAVEAFAKFRRSMDSPKMEKGIRLNSKNKRVGVANWKSLTSAKQFIETDSRTIDQYREFGDAGNGNYKAAIGHDDLVMPDVNAAFYIKSNNTGWNEFVEEFLESEKEDKFNMEVMKKLSIVALQNIKTDTTLDGDDYAAVFSDTDLTSSESDTEILNEYSVVDVDDIDEEDDDDDFDIIRDVDEIELHKRDMNSFLNIAKSLV